MSIKKKEKTVENELIHTIDTNIVYHIKHSNMTNHYKNLQSLNINNEDLKLKIDNNEKEMSITKTEVIKNVMNIQIPSEIVNNMNKKPWIRIPYPIRELKLAEYMSEKNMSKDDKDKYLKCVEERHRNMLMMCTKEAVFLRQIKPKKLRN